MLMTVGYSSSYKLLHSDYVRRHSDMEFEGKLEGKQRRVDVLCISQNRWYSDAVGRVY